MGTGMSRRWRVLIALAGALVIAAVGAAVATAVNLGTVGELNYQRESFPIQGTGGQNFFTERVRCPIQRHVTGGGLDARGQVGGEDGRPYDGGDADNVPDDGWEAEAEVATGNSGTLVIWAICDD
jgi:hypothetical protein